MQSKIKGNSLIIYINEDLDHHNAEIIRAVSDEKIIENRIRNIVFDFKNSNFMDSSGIGVMMGRYKLVENAGGKVSAVNLTPAVERIFKLSGLSKIINTYDSVDAAIEGMNS